MLEHLGQDLKDELGATEFLGYSTEKAEGQIKALIQNDIRVSSAKVGEEVLIVVNQTPFYAESGGQKGDHGIITTASGCVISIKDTYKEAETVWVHSGHIIKGSLRSDDLVILEVDHQRRSSLRSHHSATHLLHESLRRRLGPHVAQKGSLVSPDRLRFDFSHSSPITHEELLSIEEDVNNRIRQNEEVITRLMSPQEATEHGAMALFGEKYGDEVRVLFMGGREDKSESGKEYFSVELCGGTHVQRTGDIALFKIISESAVSSGVRRIEALTGATALAWLNHQEQLLHEVADTLKVSILDIPQRLTSLVDERRKLEKEVVDLRRQLVMGNQSSSSSHDKPKQINGIQFVSRLLTDVPAKDLKPMADAFKGQIKSGVIVLLSSFENKVSIVVAVTDDITANVNAVELVKIAAEVVKGKGGGGRSDMAQAGGTDIAAMPNALAAVEEFLAKKSIAA